MVYKIKHTGWLKRPTAIDTSADHHDALHIVQSLPWRTPAWRAQSADYMRRAVVHATMPQPLLGSLTAAIDQLHALELDDNERSEVANSPAEALLASRRLRALAENRAACEARWPAWRTANINILRRTLAARPQPQQGVTIASVPAVSLMQNATELVTDIVATVLGFHDEAGILPGSVLAARIRANLLAVSKTTPEAAAKNPHRLVKPSHSGLAGPELVDTYLAGTPFADLLLERVDLTIPLSVFLAHGFCFMPSGWGKTETLKRILIELFKLPDPPSIFIIDDTDHLAKEILSLDVFNPRTGRLRDRVRIYDPKDSEHLPTLNLFRLGSDDPSHSPALREAMQSATDELLTYLMTGLDVAFTGHQETMLTFVLRLMRELKKPSIRALQELLTENASGPEKSQFAADIARLDEQARRYFAEEFFTTRVHATRMQIGTRIYSLLKNRTLEKIFSAESNDFNAFEAMQNKSIVFVETSSFSLGRKGAPLFGRAFLAQILAAAIQRAEIPRSKLHPVLIFIDEAHLYLDGDDRLQEFLERTRKYLVAAHIITHDPAHASTKVRAALASTALKIAGPLDPSSRTQIATAMGTTAEMLGALNKTDTYAEAALHARGITTNGAIKVRLDFFADRAEPKMSAADYHLLRQRNRERLSGRTAASQLPNPKQPTPVPLPGLPRPSNQTPIASQPIPVTLPPPALVASPPWDPTRPPRDFGQTEHVTLNELDFTTTALCDTGAQVCALLADALIHRRKNRVSFTMTVNGHSHTLERDILRTIAVTGIHGHEVKCPVVSLSITLDGYTAHAQFAVSVDPDAKGPRIILGDTFFASAPFQARFNHGANFLADRRKPPAKRPWTSDQYEDP